MTDAQKGSDPALATTNAALDENNDQNARMLAALEAQGLTMKQILASVSTGSASNPAATWRAASRLRPSFCWKRGRAAPMTDRRSSFAWQAAGHSMPTSTWASTGPAASAAFLISRRAWIVPVLTFARAACRRSPTSNGRAPVRILRD